jgi:L-methionine (R)-S-oxide reductase
MWSASNYNGLQGREYWDALCRDLDLLLVKDEPAVTTLSNAAAFLFNIVERINWAGFYLYDGNKLILGPFGGKPACTTITIGSGVCGTAAMGKRTVIVPDVEAFPGHIACDAASRSEIVVPLVKAGKLLGVLDIDSPELDRFSEEDARGVERLREVIVENLKLPVSGW